MKLLLFCVSTLRKYGLAHQQKIKIANFFRMVFGSRRMCLDFNWCRARTSTIPCNRAMTLAFCVIFYCCFYSLSGGRTKIAHPLMNFNHFMNCKYSILVEYAVVSGLMSPLYTFMSTWCEYNIWDRKQNDVAWKVSKGQYKTMYSKTVIRGHTSFPT